MTSYILFSSSKGNCAYIKNGSDEILIDAGGSAKAICTSLESIGTSIKNINAILITHEHGDHTSALGTLCNNYDIPIYAPFLSAQAIADIYPQALKTLYECQEGVQINLSQTSINPYTTPHDSKASVGYVIDFGQEKMGYFTDLGQFTLKIVEALTGCRHLVIESNHDVDMLQNGGYPAFLKKRILSARGHLSNTSCAKSLPYFVQKGTQNIMLAHLSENNNQPQLAFNESNSKLSEQNIKINSDIFLQIASPLTPTKII